MSVYLIVSIFLISAFSSQKNINILLFFILLNKWKIDSPDIFGRVCPRGVMVKAMDSRRIITFTFGQIPLGKVWTPLSSQLGVK